MTVPEQSDLCASAENVSFPLHQFRMTMRLFRRHMLIYGNFNEAYLIEKDLLQKKKRPDDRMSAPHLAFGIGMSLYTMVYCHTNTRVNCI
jgi:hypothetical protein